MDEILKYLDEIQIDVVKRKYYNANKVNMVFDEIRGMAEDLVDENARLRALLKSREEQEKQEEEEKRSLKEVQDTYRELLFKAHERAERIVSDARAYSDAMEKLAEQRCNHAARQMESCLNMLRRREEQNLEYLNTQMKKFLSDLYAADEGETGGDPVPEDASGLEQKPGKTEEAGKSDDGLPEDLVSKINRLTREIQALEETE